VTAEKVIVAAGCMGTNEIMLRSKEQGSLPGLSDKVGLGFSTNGDYLAFMEHTKERVRLTRGPVTTSFGHFNTDDAGEDTDPDKPKFHTIEDQGIPPAFASLVGVGLPLIRSLSKGRNRRLFLLWAIFLWALKQLKLYVRAPFVNARERQEMFKTEDEIVANMMCVVGIGREAAVGQFRLGGFGQTSLRVKRTDNKEFYEDPVYKDIEKSLRDLEPHLRADDADNEKGKFRNPFLSNVFRRFNVDSITLSHPLGGCRMAKDVEHGVVDEYGRVFDERKKDQEQKIYEGLYIADGSIIPTALGVNPSLTISALALRIADKISKEL
jgi:cholesterol oxidase